MGRVISIPRNIRRKSETRIILDPENDLREIIDEYLGIEARDLFDEVIEKTIDDINGELFDWTEEFDEAIYDEDVDREELKQIWEKVNRLER